MPPYILIFVKTQGENDFLLSFSKTIFCMMQVRKIPEDVVSNINILKARKWYLKIKKWDG
jgi:hypothetical protein